MKNKTSWNNNDNDIMARKEIVIAVALTAVGLAGGYLLLPKEADIARMGVRDYQYGPSEKIYEERFAAGDRSSEVVQQLVRIHTAVGNIQRAIEVLQAYTEEHPDNADALRQLGQLYQYAQRYDEYLAVLEARAAKSDDEVVLRELSELYTFFQMPEKNREVLQRLAQLKHEDTPETFRSLASYQALDGHFAEVAALLKKLHEQFPNDYEYKDVVVHTNALLEIKDADKAVALVQSWRADPRSDKEQVAFLIDMLHYQGSLAQARKVLSDIPQEEIIASPDLLHSYVLVLLGEGRREDAYKMLADLHDANQLPDVLVPDLMYMAAVEGDNKRFDALYRANGFSRLSEKELVDIWKTVRRLDRREVMREIEKQVAAADATAYPLLRTILLIDTKKPAYRAALTAQLESKPDNETLLRLAESTSAAGYREDTKEILKHLPAYEKMNRAELTVLEMVYLQTGDKKAQQDFVAYLRQSGQFGVSDSLGIRTAAALGDKEALVAWHVNNRERTDSQLLNDVFYFAANAGHLNLALEVAEWQTDPRMRAEARSGVADIYTRLGRYEAALALLDKQAPAGAADARNRMFILSKLAPKSTVYRERLHAMAREWFPKSSARMQEEIVYTLLAVGSSSEALPYMQTIANKRGGQWNLTYADALVNAGRTKDAVPYYLKAAQDKRFDSETRLNIAYALTAHGEQEAAEKLLFALADEKATREAAVQQLAYLWGPRPSEQQLTWLVGRWRSADEADKALYSEVLSYKMSPEMLDAFVAKYPELRGIPAVNEEYLYLLAREGRLQGEIARAAEDARARGDSAYLTYLADMARDFGASREAKAAYDAALEVTPENRRALVGATIASATIADYEAIPVYFQRFEALEKDTPSVVPVKDAHRAVFVYAEELRRQQKMAEAQPYYAQVIAMQQAGEQDAYSYSIAAQSAAWMGNDEQSNQLFDAGFARFPDNAVLRADKTSLLVEQKRYAEARDAWKGIELAQDADAPKVLDTALVTSYDADSARMPVVLNNEQQVLVYTSPEKADAPRFWAQNLQEHPAIGYVTEGYDQVLLVTKTGYRFVVTPQANGGWAVSAVEAAGASAGSETAQLHLRKELLAARMDLETGHMDEATDRIVALKEVYHEDPQYLGFAANTFYYSEMWPTAKNLIEDAAQRAPENKDVARLKRDIDRIHPDHVRADITLNDRGDNREITTSIGGETKVHDQWRVGAVVRNHDVKTRGEQQLDGTIGSRKGTRNTLHAYGVYTPEEDSMFTFHFFANSDTPGAGVDYTFVNPLGVTTIGGRYHEPYLEFTEGLLDNAVRDRIAIDHTIKPRTDLSIGGGLSYNNYSIDDDSNIMSTIGVDASVVYTWRQAQPYIGLGYGLNAEYETDNTFQQTTGGNNFRQLPLRSREFHSATVTAAYDFAEHTYGSVLLGYGFDRLGGSGPSAEVNFNHEIYPNVDLGARAFYGVDASNSDNNVNIYNGYLRYRF